jgi:phosphate transport system substrate-binding protein
MIAAPTTLVLAAVMMSVTAARAQEVDPDYPMYVPSPGVSGNIKSVGSDTMNNLMTLWAEGFRQFYPAVLIEIEGKGSSTAPPALIQGQSSFGPMSREMKAREVNDFQRKYGYKPTKLRTAVDMLAVYVHRNNPIAKKGLTMEELDGIFSQTRKTGHANVKTWGELGLGGEWKNKPINTYGRNEASGTYGYFKENVLREGDYKDTVASLGGSSAVIQAVGKDEAGIGYSGMGYKSANVKIVPLAPRGSKQYIPAKPSKLDKYPLARFLYLYVNHRPNSRLEPLRAEFLKYIFSEEGQATVIQDGYIPVGFELAQNDMAQVDLKLKRDE